MCAACGEQLGTERWRMKERGPLGSAVAGLERGEGYGARPRPSVLEIVVYLTGEWRTFMLHLHV